MVVKGLGGLVATEWVAVQKEGLRDCNRGRRRKEGLRDCSSCSPLLHMVGETQS